MTTTNEHTGQILINRTPDAEIKRIMIVDDSNDVNLTFKIVPGESDKRLRVHSFNDPLVALQEFKPDLYDLVIIDFLMPNGVKLYDKLRALDSKVKICFLTAESESYYEVIKEAFREFGTNCSISKPIANEDLIKHVKDMLELEIYHFQKVKYAETKVTLTSVKTLLWTAFQDPSHNKPCQDYFFQLCLQNDFSNC